MSVRIQFDDPHAFYTNLDFISGKIILNLTNDETISAIMVKLEGESRTVLMRPMPGPQHTPQQLYNQRNARQGGIATENHKILYKVSQVFPSLDPASGTTTGLSYTLRAGQHVYPFRFKIPINNGCSDPQSQQMGLGSGFGGLGLGGLQQLQYSHVKKTLPPSLTGFPGEAEIRYFVKVTVQRPSLFKENRRSAIGFRFLPIESPRPQPTTNELFAKRPFAFQAGLAPYAKKSSMFKKNPTKLSDTPPKGELEARLPSPAILTCNEPLPLRVILRRTSESPEAVFLTSLQVSLFGYTNVRAQDVTRTETSTWVLLSRTGLEIPIGSPSDALKKEIFLDKALWEGVPLPNTVAPSFQTCNLARKYELEVRVGVGFGVVGEVQPQIIALPLRFQVEIYSGIPPPAALLTAMASRPTKPISTSNLNPANIPIPTTPLQSQPPAMPLRPGQTAPTPADPLYPPQLGTAGAAGMDEAPPSYEDAVAEDIHHVAGEGQRREYSGVTDVDAPGLDEKGSAPSYSMATGGGGSGGGSGRGKIV